VKGAVVQVVPQDCQPISVRGPARPDHVNRRREGPPRAAVLHIEDLELHVDGRQVGGVAEPEVIRVGPAGRRRDRDRHTPNVEGGVGHRHQPHLEGVRGGERASLLAVCRNCGGQAREEQDAPANAGEPARGDDGAHEASGAEGRDGDLTVFRVRYVPGPARRESGGAAVLTRSPPGRELEPHAPSTHFR